MTNSVLFRTRVVRSLLGSTGVLNIILAVLGLLFSIGLFVLPSSASDYTQMKTLFSVNHWVAAFFTYSICKLIVSLYRTPKIFKGSVNLLGLWLWNFLVLSFLLLDTNIKPSPVELFLVAPIICEVWELAASMFFTKYTENRRVIHD